MSSLIESALNNPAFTSIRITGNSITFSSLKRRRKSQEGDIKWKHGKRYVRRQRWDDFYKGYLVRNGRPMFEWVQEDSEKEPNPPPNYKKGSIIPSKHYF